MQERVKHQENKLLQHTEELAKSFEDVNLKQKQVEQLQRTMEEWNIKYQELNQQFEENRKKLLEKSE